MRDIVKPPLEPCSLAPRAETLLGRPEPITVGTTVRDAEGVSDGGIDPTVRTVVGGAVDGPMDEGATEPETRTAEGEGDADATEEGGIDPTVRTVVGGAVDEPMDEGATEPDTRTAEGEADADATEEGGIDPTVRTVVGGAVDEPTDEGATEPDTTTTEGIRDGGADGEEVDGEIKVGEVVEVNREGDTEGDKELL